MTRTFTRLILSVIVWLCLLPGSLYADTVTHIKIDGGAILNCFGWSYKMIQDKLDAIKAANFTAVQVSSVQPLPPTGCFGSLTFTDAASTPIPDWYRVCAPLGLRIISDDDTKDHTPLGTLAELKSLIAAAHAKGIGVVAAVEANQVYASAAKDPAHPGLNDHDTWMDSNRPWDGVKFLRSRYDASHWTAQTFNDVSRKSFTQATLNAAVLDLNTEDTYEVIPRAQQMVKDLWNMGVDGIYWYHAKYIGLQYGVRYSNDDYGMTANDKYSDSDAEGSGFWPELWQTRLECKSETDATNTIFYYGNFNLDPYFKGEYINLYGVPDHDPNQFFNTVDDKDYCRAIREYTKYMCIADAWYAKSAMMQDGVSFAAGYFNQLASSYRYQPTDYKNLPHSLNGFYAALNTDLVYLAEDENTYLQNPEVLHEPMIPTNLDYENRPTNIYGTDVVNRTYAAMAGHNNVTLVYFARPSQNAENFILGNKVLSQQSLVPYCYFIDTNDWTKTDETALRAYYYGGTNARVDSPGVSTGTDATHHTELTKVGQTDGHNVYILKFTDGKAPQSVFFNNMTDGKTGSQTADLAFASGTVYNAGKENKSGGEMDVKPVVDKPVDDFYHIWVKSTVKPRIHAWVEDGNDLTGWQLTDGNGDKGEPTSTVKDKDGNTWYFFALPKQALDQVNFIIHANNKSDNQKFKPANLDELNNTADRYYVYDDATKSLTETTAPTFTGDTPPSMFMTVYVRVKNSNATLPNLYYWKDSEGMFFCDWPGTTLKHRIPTTDGSVWYYARIPRHLSLDDRGNSVVKPENLIINSNGKQTANITGVTETERYYYFDENTVSNGKGYNNVTAVASLPDLVTYPTEDISVSNAFTDKHIAAVNKFHTSLNGENDFKEAEYNHDGTKANIETICRQNGAIMVMRDPTNFQMAHTITNPSSKLQYMVAQGDNVLEKKSYTDAVNTGVTFTVGKMNIEAPANAFDDSGIAVIMTENKKDPGYNVSIASGTQGYGSLELTVTPTGDTKIENLYYEIAINPEFKNESRRFWGRYIIKYKTTGKRRVPSNGKIEIPYEMPRFSYGSDNNRFRTYYVRFFNGKEVSQEPYVYYVHDTSSSGFVHAHLLYFRFPETEIFDRNNVTLYAWDDEDGNSYPLVKKGGDKLADEGNSSEWTWPVDAIYDASQVYGNELDMYNSYTGKDKVSTYDVHNGTNYNDVVYYGGHKISRYTVGLPNFDLRLIKFRLSYHNPYGFTQQLDPKIVDDDQFYDVALDKDGNLGIGGMYVMIGDALYDNNTWKYTTPTADESKNEFEVDNTFWRMQTLDEYKQGAARGPVFMNFSPDESRSLSTEGHNVEVATYTGQFIQGKTFRFGTPFDLRKSFVKDETVKDSAVASAEEIAAGIYNTPYKIYLKDVDSTYIQGNIGNANWQMVRGRYARNLSRNDETNEDLTWSLPSGIYTVKFYSIDDNGAHTYYYTISRPTVEYDYMAEADDRIPTRTKEIMQPMSVTENGETKIKYWYKDIPAVGHPGYKNTEINIYTGTEEQQSKFKPNGYTLEAIDNTAGTSNTSLLSNFPETGRYRVVYTPGHGNTPKYVEESTTDGSGEPTLTSSTNAESGATLQCLLGFRAKNYDANSINGTMVKEGSDGGTELNGLSGHWTSYSDGLPRKRPSQVTAYYASGYDLDKYGNLDAVYLTKLSGDILPANTGLLLQYPTDVTSGVNYDYGTDVTVLGQTVNSNFVYMEPENAETTSAVIMQPSGTNYLIPFIANDNSVTVHDKETEWKEHANVKRPESEYINSILAYRTINDESTQPVLDFFKIGEFSTNYELRKSFLSIPKNDPNVSGGGDVVFNAKPRFAAAANKSVCVVTDRIDVIFGTNQQVPTGIKAVNMDNSGDDNAPYYNLQGIRVEHPSHGVFIHNGKKVVIR